MARMCSFMFLTYLFQILPASSNATGSHLRASLTSDGIDAKAEDTIRALDMNGNGMVDKSEIAVFAKNQGLSSEEVLADFHELDANKDGELDSSEIGGLLGESRKASSSDAQTV